MAWEKIMETEELYEMFSYEKMAEYENIYGLCEAIDLLYKDIDR